MGLIIVIGGYIESNRTIMAKKVFTIAKRSIGEGHPCFIVAEMSGNHKQDINRAYAIIDAAKEARVDAIKVQTYTPDTLTINSNKHWFKPPQSSLWKNQTLYQLYQSAYTPWEWLPKLKKYAEEKGLIFFSTPFDKKAVDVLEKLDVPVYKIASFENEDYDLIDYIAKTGKPVILSRGLASIKETKGVLKTIKSAGITSIVILHCISAYPADIEDMNIATVADIKTRFKVISGLSDHSLGQIASIAAVALGAKVIEKHLTLSRSGGGPDASFSLEPKEMKLLVQMIRDTERCIGRVRYTASSNEAKNRIFKRSLFVIEDIKKGERFTNENIRSIRPGYGLQPKELSRVIGRTCNKDIKRGIPLRWSYIQ